MKPDGVSAARKKILARAVNVGPAFPCKGIGGKGSGPVPGGDVAI
jgi:hypothetical protein